jgi:hypothetical protein
MRSHLNDFTLIQHQDQVGDHHRLNAMRDDESGAVLHQVIQRFADLGFGLRVHGRGGVIEDQDARILQQGARNGHALLLPAGERHAFFTDHGVVAIGESHDHVMHGGGFRGALRSPPASRHAHAVQNILADRAAEQERFLLHDADLLTQDTCAE